MSWQTYVDTNLVGSGHITHAALLGFDGSVWARSAGFPDLSAVIPGTSLKESAALVKDNFEKAANPQSRGVWAGKLKYMCVMATPTSVYGKGNKGGIVTAKTGKCVVVGIYVEPQQTGNATKVVEELADYLKGVGY